jgi:hypothetical protein
MKMEMEQGNIEKLTSIVNNRSIVGVFPPENFTPRLKDILSVRIIKRKLIAEGIPPEIFLEAHPNTAQWLENLQNKHPNWDRVLEFLL